MVELPGGGVGVEVGVGVTVGVAVEGGVGEGVGVGSDPPAAKTSSSCNQLRKLPLLQAVETILT